eukprot:scaffold736_cov254-Pinguiococcus_pyrenoidosus.AAC.5
MPSTSFTLRAKAIQVGRPQVTLGGMLSPCGGNSKSCAGVSPRRNDATSAYTSNAGSVFGKASCSSFSASFTSGGGGAP